MPRPEPAPTSNDQGSHSAKPLASGSEGRASGHALVLDRKELGAVLGAFVVTRVALCLVIFASMVIIPVRPGHRLVMPDNLLGSGLVHWDSLNYVTIALHGYASPMMPKSTIAFFPLYPLLVHVLAGIAGNVYWAGIGLANGAFLLALFVLYRLTREEFDDATAARAVFYLAAAPAGIFFSALYSESLFLLFVVLTLWQARRAHWLLAGLAGSLAALTRNTGLLLTVVIAVEGISQQSRCLWPAGDGPLHPADLARGVRTTVISARRSLLSAALVPLGTLGYMLYLNYRVHDPLAFLRVEGAWGRHIPGFGFGTLLPSIGGSLGMGPHVVAGQVNAGVLVNVVAALGYGPLVLAVIYAMRPIYGAYSALFFVIPLSTGLIESMVRYCLLLVPCVMLLACWGGRPWVERAVLGISLPMQACIAITFSHSYPPF